MTPLQSAARVAEAGTPDPRLWRIPRSAVLQGGTVGEPDAGAFPRVDRQGPSQLTVSGRAAILLALERFGVGPGDQVLVPTYHCPTMVEPVVRRGATPVFYPIDVNGAADLAALETLELSAAKVLLAAHFFGLPQDLRAVRAFCDRRGLKLIEDCAHAFFGRSAQGPVGSLGDAAIASLPKFFAAVEGGCLTFRSTETALPVLASPGAKHQLRVAWDTLELAADAGRPLPGGSLLRALVRLKRRLRGGAAPVLGPPPDGGGSPFETIDERRAHAQVAGMVRQLVRRSDAITIVESRRRNYRRFAEQFAATAGMRPLVPVLAEGAVPYVFPLFVDKPAPLYAALRTRGVPLYRWDILWPGTPSLPGDATPSWSTQVFQLCLHQSMSIDDVDAVAAAIKSAHAAAG